MVNKQLHYASMVLLSFGLFCLAPSNRVLGQDTNAGASPAWTVGNSEASVVIEVFNDYQCPPCAFFNQELKRVQTKYAGRVRIVFRNFPITMIHQNALAAAQTAEAAGLQGKFVEMIDLLYKNARKWKNSKKARNSFVSYARVLHLNIKRFRKDVDGVEVHERIRLDVERGKQLKVLGTPTVFVNGEVIPYQAFENLDPVIEKVFSPKP